MPDVSMDKIVSLCKRRGFVFPGSEIYGGFSGFWDYGPLGVELKNNIKQLWWRMFVQDRDDMCGLDAAIVMIENAHKHLERLERGDASVPSPTSVRGEKNTGLQIAELCG